MRLLRRVGAGISLVFRLIPANVQAQSATARSPACGVHCGTERWAVKTLTDRDTGTILAPALLTTVRSLRQLHAPPRDSLPEAGRYTGTATEHTIFQLHAVVVGWKNESDSDYHIVVADPGFLQQTMIVEAPNPHCALACSSPHAAQFAAVRAAVRRVLGRPRPTFTRLKRPVPVVLTGVGFLDFIHGQRGVAPNGVELHPLLTFQASPQ